MIRGKDKKKEGEEKLQKFILSCSHKHISSDYRLSLYFQGWLMERLPKEVAEQLHHSRLKPYTIHSLTQATETKFILTSLDEELTRLFRELLFNQELKTLAFNRGQKIDFVIEQRESIELTEKELSDLFYQEGKIHAITLRFLTPTSFKVQGEYLFFPDTRLIFQNLMKKYQVQMVGEERVDLDLLDEISQALKIVNYRLSSSYYPIHRVFIPGMIGEVKFIIKGNQTLANYIWMLLKYGEYAGLGIKTTMGMGAISATMERKVERDGRKTS